MERITLTNGTTRAKVKTRDIVTGTRLDLATLLELDTAGKLPQHWWFIANDGTAKQCRTNGRLRRWKRDLSRVELPVKYGLYECATLDAAGIARLLLDVELTTVPVLPA
jgi:hypothetical protein